MHTYLEPRRGLPGLQRRLGRGPLTIGYLGGSLTAMKEGWRPLFHQMLQQSLPSVPPHRQLHVGRGGVGSASGAFFVQDEICGKDPDLVFVEYAINDSYDAITPPALRLSAMEGIVRSIKGRHPQCDICFIYMHHVQRGPQIERVIASHEKVAEHYGIPSLQVGRSLIDLVAGGRWSFQGENGVRPLLRDTCHPVAQGSQIIAGLVGSAVAEMLSQPASPVLDLPLPMTANPLVGGRVVPLTDEQVRGPFSEHREVVGNFEQPIHWRSLPVGSRLVFRAQGALAGLFVVVGPRSGVLRACIGAREIKYNLFDPWCSYDRISTCILSETPEDFRVKDVEVTLEMTDEPVDHSVCPAYVPSAGPRTLDVVSLYLV